MDKIFKFEQENLGFLLNFLLNGTFLVHYQGK
jgi:hypothetical protein